MLIRLPHYNRLQTLKLEADLKVEVNDLYQNFQNEFCNSVSDDDYASAAIILNTYMDHYKKVEENSKFLTGKEKTGNFGDRSKVYSSVLEEAPVLMMRDRITRMIRNTPLESANLVLGAQNCLIRKCISPNGEMINETKAIDFCFAVEVKNSPQTFVPLFGMEVKKYMDKTMFGTVMDTVKSLAYLRSRTRYGFIVEDEARSSDVVLNSPIWESEFVLSKSQRAKKGRNPIQSTALENLHLTLELWASRSVADLMS